jgi:hypothetical protein
VISARFARPRHSTALACVVFSAAAFVFATATTAAAAPSLTAPAASTAAATTMLGAKLRQVGTQVPAYRAPASYSALDDSSYSDRSGDSGLAPDITTTSVGLSGGLLTFRIRIGDLGPGLVEGHFVSVLIDSDRNDRTGCDGNEWTLVVLGGTYPVPDVARLARCIGGRWSINVPQGRFSFSDIPGSGLYGPGYLIFRVGAADIGGSSFRFLIGSLYEDGDDDIDVAGPYLFGAGSSGSAAPAPPPVRRTPPPVKVVPLTISRHADVRTEATGPNGAKVRYSPAQVRGAKSVSYSRPSGSVFPLGKTVVTVTARSGSRVARSSFTVRVVDTTPPQLGPLTNVTATLVAGGATNASYGPVVARDRVDRNVAVNCTPASGAPFNPGATSVACTARDRSGNSAGATYVVVVPMVSAPLTLQAATGFNWNGSALASATTVLTLAPLASADGSPVGYTWAATNGSISGNGGAASWARALAGSQPAPGIVTLTVVRDGTVETYTLAFP